MSTRRPSVSVCIPAYRSESFIGKTLESVFRQTLPDIEVVVSNDGGEHTPTLERYHDQGRIRLVVPPERLGWVRNSNFALSHAQGESMMILPHDDMLAPTYLARCIALLKADPATIAAYSDITVRPDGRWQRSRVFPVSEVRGPPEHRVATVMRDLYNGISYRAVLRRADFERYDLRLPENPPHDLWSDTLWMLRKAVHGELRRIPEPLYYKRLHPQNTHKTWDALPVETLRNAWEHHCAQMGEIASGAVIDPALIKALVDHRRVPARVREAPASLILAFGGTPRPPPSLAMRISRRVRTLISRRKPT
ncbi:MAG: glycosyltransferase family 2 protein [Pseudomonadota bacterium]